MSFSDISTGDPNRRDFLAQQTGSSKLSGYLNETNGKTNSDKLPMNATFSQLSDSLRDLKKNNDLLERKINEMKFKNVNAKQKKELDSSLNDARDFANRLKVQFDSQQRLLEARQAPRSAESIQNRQTLAKLLKDFELLKNKLNQLFEQSNQIKITDYNSNNNNFNQNSTNFDNNSNENNIMGPTATDGPRLIRAYKEKDVDTAIMEERERDIRKINQDLRIVNEMFKDMASLVVEQGAAIEEIHDATEKSHERAQAGLKQVQQAAAYQPSCVVS